MFGPLYPFLLAQQQVVLMRLGAVQAALFTSPISLGGMSSGQLAQRNIVVGNAGLIGTGTQTASPTNVRPA